MNEKLAYPGYLLAQVNVSYLRDDADPTEEERLVPATAALVRKLQRTGAGLADFISSGGQEILPDGIFDHPGCYANLTLWTGPQALLDFLEGPHRRPRERYAHLFENIGDAALALWWVGQDDTPNLREGEERLHVLHELGPTALAFDLETALEFPPQPVSASIGYVQPGQLHRL